MANRRAPLIAAIAVAALAGCAGPADRMESWQNDLSARILEQIPVVEDVEVRGGERARVGLAFGDLLTDPDAEAEITDALVEAHALLADSPLGSLPPVVSAAAVPFGDGVRWTDFEPADADRYAAASVLWLELNRGEWGDLLSVPQVDVLPDSVLVRIRLDGLGRLDTDDEQTITSELEQAGFASVEISYV